MSRSLLLLKILFLITTQLAMTATATAPSSRPSSTERVKRTGMEHVVPVFPYLLKTLAWSPCILETLVILTNSFTSLQGSPVALLVYRYACRPGNASAIRITPLFLLGWAISLAGGLLRVHCYRVLGHHFTFELSIRDKHKLITHGPYAYVRHPSYTGGYLVWVGVLLTHLTSGSWVTECLGLRDHRQLQLGLWISLLLLCAIPISRRMVKEDELLKGHFNEEWEQWKERVPYRLVPLLY